MSNRTPDLILRPHQKRDSRGHKIPLPTVKTYDGRRRIIAEVSSLFMGDHGYHHPVVQIGVADEDDDLAMFDRVSVSFQRNARTALDGKPARGFLGDGKCSHSYAGKVEVRVEDLRRHRHWQELIIRAHEAGRKAGWRTDSCQLTQLVVGLRLLGVEVRVWNPAFAEAKEWRLAERTRAAQIAEVA